jgi:hypothetical protein
MPVIDRALCIELPTHGSESITRPSFPIFANA